MAIIKCALQRYSGNGWAGWMNIQRVYSTKRWLWRSESMSVRDQKARSVNTMAPKDGRGRFLQNVQGERTI